MQRFIKRISLALIAFSFLLVAARADSITIASLGTAADSGESNSDGTTITVAPNAAWAAALPGSIWVSFGLTGNPSTPGFFTVPNGTTVTFSDQFNIAGAPAGGTVMVMADDSASVVLNGITLMPEASVTGNTYATCSDFGIGCLVPVTISLPAADLRTGANTLSFLVSQRDGSSFGLDYAGTVSDTDPMSVYEPASLELLGFGLFAMSAAGFIRTDKRSSVRL